MPTQNSPSYDPNPAAAAGRSGAADAVGADCCAG